MPTSQADNNDNQKSHCKFLQTFSVQFNWVFRVILLWQNEKMNAGSLLYLPLSTQSFFLNLFANWCEETI